MANDNNPYLAAYGVTAEYVQADLHAAREQHGSIAAAACVLGIGKSTLDQTMRGVIRIGPAVLEALYGEAGKQGAPPPETPPAPPAPATPPDATGITVAELLRRARTDLLRIENDFDERTGAWKANPWVAAITFDVHRCNIDQMEAASD